MAALCPLVTVQREVLPLPWGLALLHRWTSAAYAFRPSEWLVPAAYIAGVALSALSYRHIERSPRRSRWLLVSSVVAYYLASLAAHAFWSRPPGLAVFLVGGAPFHVAVALCFKRELRPPEVARCVGCGYDLRGLPPAAPCPECGRLRSPGGATGM